LNDQLRKRNKELEEENAELRRQAREKGERVEGLEEEVERLGSENMGLMLGKRRNEDGSNESVRREVYVSERMGWSYD
jgi:hypothetical protein